MRPRRSKVADAKHVERVAPLTLPAWFTKNRVHGHTRLILRLWHDTDEFTLAAAGFKALGAHVFTRHVKTGAEDPWWPTGQPPGRNVVQQFIKNAHAEGLKIFTYYWHMSETSLQKPHPDWVCKKLNGNPISGRTKGAYLDITGPYREVVLTRLLELAAMGTDGLFFDFRHLPPRGCWHTALAQAWEALTGAPPPDDDDNDPVYRQFLDFKAKKIEETFIYWRDRVKADFPNVSVHRQHDDRPGVDGPRNDNAAGAPRRFGQERIPACPQHEIQQGGLHRQRSQNAGRSRTSGTRMDGAPRRC